MLVGKVGVDTSRAKLPGLDVPAAFTLRGSTPGPYTLPSIPVGIF